MGILSSTVSLTRFKIDGDIPHPVMETIHKGLSENVIGNIDGDTDEKAVGWTSFETPFQPEFESASLVIGPFLVFSIRIDKKAIPKKVIQKMLILESAKKLAEDGRDHLSKHEKQAIKDCIIQELSLKIPATPTIVHVLWRLEEKLLWFFTTQKAACEALETLFYKSFHVRLIRLFPYTLGFLSPDVTDAEKNILTTLPPARFMV